MIAGRCLIGIFRSIPLRTPVPPHRRRRLPPPVPHDGELRHTLTERLRREPGPQRVRSERRGVEPGRFRSRLDDVGDGARCEPLGADRPVPRDAAKRGTVGDLANRMAPSSPTRWRAARGRDDEGDRATGCSGTLRISDSDRAPWCRPRGSGRSPCRHRSRRLGQLSNHESDRGRDARFPRGPGLHLRGTEDRSCRCSGLDVVGVGAWRSVRVGTCVVRLARALEDLRAGLSLSHQRRRGLVGRSRRRSSIPATVMLSS